MSAQPFLITHNQHDATADSFWVIDDGRSTDALIRNGRRFRSEAEARAEVKEGEGLLRLTPSWGPIEVKS